MDNGDLAAKIDALRVDLPGMIQEAIERHEETFMHMTPVQYGEMLGGKTPQELIADHTELEKGQEYMIGQMNALSTQQDYMAEVVLGPESTSYDGEVTRSGGLQTLVLEMNKKGEIKTRLAAKDRVALYVAAIGGLTSVVVALIIAFM